MQFYGARLEQYWSSTAAALQLYWSRFAEILLKQHCNSIGAVLEEFSGGTEQYCSSGAVPQQSWRNIGARLEYACSIGQLAPEYCSNILLDISICIPYSGIPRILFEYIVGIFQPYLQPYWRVSLIWSRTGAGVQ